MLKIVCVNAGNYLGKGVEYTNKLFDMCWRNISDKTPFQFTCFTDCPDGYSEGIRTESIPAGLSGWWNKLYLFKDGVFDHDDRIVYFDLDTVITGCLDDILKYDGIFAILRDFYRPNGLQSSVMSWRGDWGHHIWREYEKAGFPDIKGGDQAWIERHVLRPDIWQDLYPGLFVSFKVHCGLMFPKGAKVVVFHGTPRPHEVSTGFVPYVWKIGGGTATELISECNTPEIQIKKNIIHAAGLPFPWLDAADIHSQSALIVGGGPSLKDDIEEIRARQRHGEIIFATNGVWNELAKRGIYADYHLMADARPENAQFIPNGVPLRACLYASQCHETVFEKAKTKDVIIWHPYHIGIGEVIGTERNYALVGGGSTIGLQSMVISYILGFRDLHLFGMDSSYKDGEGHAYQQKLNEGDRIIDVQVGEQIFRAAPWMASQVDEFKEVAVSLVREGCQISVHGSGLLPCVANLMAQEPVNLTAADERASAILERLSGIKKPAGVEVGVFAGDLSKRLLARSDLTLHMVDSWKEHGQESAYAKSGDFHGALTQEQQDQCLQHTVNVTGFAGDRAKIIRRGSLSVAKQFEDASLDFVFIDADHTYEAVKADIAAWAPKVKPSGWISGHDYENTEYPAWGVKKAVDEYANSVGLLIEKGLNFTWFIKKGEQHHAKI